MTIYALDTVAGNDANSGIVSGLNRNAKRTVAGLAGLWAGMTGGDTLLTNGIIYDVFNVLGNGNASNRLIIDGQGSTTFIPSFSLNDASSITTGGVAFNAPWVAVGGTIFKKAIPGFYPRYIIVNNVKIPATLSDVVGQAAFNQNEAYMIAHLAPNEWAVLAGVLYVRLPSGDPFGYDIRMNAGHSNARAGFNVDSKNYLLLRNFDVKYGLTNNTSEPLGNIGIFGTSSYVLLDNVSSNEGLIGTAFAGGNNNGIINSDVQHNDGVGIYVDAGGVGQTSNNIEVYNCDIMYNGAEPFWEGTAYSFAQDGDNVGVGENGGTVTNLKIVRNRIKFGGPQYQVMPAFVTSGLLGNAGIAHGSGIKTGTTFAFSVTMDVIGNEFDGNKNTALYSNNQFAGGTIAGNVFKETKSAVGGANPATYTVLLQNPTTQLKTVRYYNNTMYNNHTNKGLFIDYAGTNAAVISENIFYNAVAPGTDPGNQNDLHIMVSSNTNVIENKNIIYRTDEQVALRFQDAAAPTQSQYTMSDHSTLASDYLARGKGQNDSFVDPGLNLTTLVPSTVMALTGGSKWWGTGSRPVSANGVPYPDASGISKGAIQDVTGKFHPANIAA